MLKQLFQYIYDYGTDQTDDPKTKRDIRMLSIGLLICALNAAAWTPLNWRVGNTPSTIGHIVLCVLLLVVIRVNKTKHKLAFTLTFILVESGIFYLAVYAIPGQYTEYYFLVMAFVLHAFSINRMTYMVMTLANTVMFGLSLYLVPPIAPNGNLIYTPIALIIVTLLITRLVRIQKGKYEELINEQNKKLQNQSQELQKLSDLKSEFFANISHELRTPLTLIQGQLEALKSKTKNELEQEDRIFKATRNTRQLAYMIDDLLDLSRLDLKALTIQPMPTDMVLFVRRLVASFQSLAESEQVRLEVAVTKTSAAVARIDIRQFEKVISNLLYNAFKFTPPGGLVRVTIGGSAANIVLEVFNNGPGIPEADLPQLFDRFYQVKDQSKSTEGTGLGLAIAREIVELHEGTITAANVDGGVTFSVSVSATSELVAEAEQNTIELEDANRIISEKLAVLATAKPLIFVVEDNLEMQDYLDEVLSPYFRLEKAANGKEALDKLVRLKPHLILADVMMPEMDGLELLKNLKQSASYFNIPVMFLTALASQQDKLRGLRLGLDDYLVKPFDRDELVIRIANQVHNLGRRLALARELEQEEPGQKPDANVLTVEDEQLIRKAQAYIESHISDPGLSVKMVAESLGMSERQWYRRVAALVGMTPNEFIMEIKLQYARKLLLAGKVVKLSQLVRELGYSKDSYFSNLFYQRFGKRPSDFIDR